MTLKIKCLSTPPAKTKADTAAVFIYKGGKMGSGAEALDKKMAGFIRHQLKQNRKFTGAKGQILVLSAPEKAIFARVVLMGADDPEQHTDSVYEDLGGKLYAALSAAGATAAVLLGDKQKKAKDKKDVAVLVALGALLRSYSFDRYKQKKKDNKTPVFGTLHVVAAGAAKHFSDLEKLARGVFFARDLSNEPPNILYPESFAARARKELAPLGIKVEVIDHKRMKQLGFGAHLAVGQGSARPPRVVLMHWMGASKGKKKKGARPIAFVGKGVTFDTGGISIKPAGGMDEMKHDMSGAAAVTGVMKTLALRKAKVDVIGIVGLAENMPSHNAYRPGDVIKSLSGKTIEVLNTDAEGRLVLCDALTYIQNKHDPRVVIDLATLTGAIVVALGGEYAGVFANDDGLWQNLAAASAASGDKLWRMPLDEAYSKQVDSHIADLKNIGNGRDAGSCTAAGFLQRFIDDKRIWAHIDIAGTAWDKSGSATCPKGATGFGVRLLDNLVKDHYES